MRHRIAIVAAIVLPVAVTFVVAWIQQRQDTRDDELVARYECDPPDRCSADFDGDGTPDPVRVYGDAAQALLVVETRTSLRLPYDHTDGTFRTHTAVATDAGAPRLLVYDGANHRPVLRAAFRWGGASMVTVTPTPLECKILAAMAAHDDTGGWNDRTVFRPAWALLRLVVMYAVVAGLLMLYFKLTRRRLNAPGSL